MKIYHHLNIESFTNTYLVVNEKSQKAVIIDPSKVTQLLINQIEDANLKLCGVLVTHKHKSHTSGIPTLKKIYNSEVFAADPELAMDKNLLKDDGAIYLADMRIEYYSVPGHTSDSLVYKIGNILFTGDVIYTGRIGSSSCNYTKKRLCSGIRTKVFSQPDSTVIMPGHGPLSSVEAEKKFNTEVSIEE